VSHYLVYHSAEKMGHSYRDDDETPSVGYSIVTKKSAVNIPGNTIWVISGEGQPRDYRLEYWFDAIDLKTIEDPEFSTQVFGSEGYTFKGGVPIGHLPWFRTFRERMGNFSLGLQPLNDLEVRNLSAAAQSAGGQLPN